MIEICFGHFPIILVDIDLSAKIKSKILKEKKKLSFFVGIMCENLQGCCKQSKMIGHSVGNCKRLHKHEEDELKTPNK